MLGQVGTAFFVLSFQVSRLGLINDIQIYNDWSSWGTWPRLAWSWSWSTPMTTILIILQPGTLLIRPTITTVITTHQRLWILQDEKLRHEWWPQKRKIASAKSVVAHNAIGKCVANVCQRTFSMHLLIALCACSTRSIHERRWWSVQIISRMQGTGRSWHGGYRWIEN